MKSLLQALFFFLLVPQINFAQWVEVGLEDESIKDITAQNSLIFAVTSDSGMLYRSTDNGITWSTIFELGGVIDIEISPLGDVYMVKDSVFGAGSRQVFQSSDAGTSWFLLSVFEQICPQPNHCFGPYNVKVNPIGIIFCGYISSGRSGGHTTVAMSTDNGVSWSPTFTTGGEIYDFKGNSVLTIGNYWEPTTGGISIYLSDDGGFQWLYLGSPPPPVAYAALSLCLNGNILLGDLSGLFISTDSCTIWTQVSSISIQSGLSIESGGWLVGNDSLGVFLFSDDGDSLGSRNDGLTNLNIHTLTIDNNDYVYAGTDNGVWNRPLSEIVTSIKEISTYIPSEILLLQNYPNPFNPSTKIKYSIPQSSNIMIKVFDVLGNEIETLVNEEKLAGTYELTWNAANLPSGVYFYQLRAGSLVQTKKMILLR